MFSSEILWIVSNSGVTEINELKLAATIGFSGFTLCDLVGNNPLVGRHLTSPVSSSPEQRLLLVQWGFPPLSCCTPKLALGVKRSPRTICLRRRGGIVLSGKQECMHAQKEQWEECDIRFHPLFLISHSHTPPSIGGY